MLLLHAQRREQREQKATWIDEDRLFIEQPRVEQETLSSNRAFNLQSQRFELDQCRLELDVQSNELDKEQREAQAEQ